MTELQIEELTRMLLQGAENFGYTGDVWTGSRIRELIEIKFDIKFSVRHVRRLMKKLGWTPQKPATYASQKNTEEVKLWREQRWPEKKNTGQQCKAIKTNLYLPAATNVQDMTDKCTNQLSATLIRAKA